MRYREMGNTGIRVSEIGFGSGDNAGLLVKAEPKEQIKAIERALELGINYFDTSPDYGKGLAEINIGKAMREIGFRPVIATKVEIMPDELDHIADAVVESVEDSLKRLQLDHVDIVQIHNPPSIETDTTVPGWIHVGLDDYLGAEGALEGLERLRRAGKTRFFGFANEDADATADDAPATDTTDADTSSSDLTEVAEEATGKKGRRKKKDKKTKKEKPVATTAVRVKPRPVTSNPLALHGEKLGLATALLLAIYLVYSGFSTETFDQRPDDLTSAASQADQKITNSSWDTAIQTDEKLRERVNTPDYVASVNSANQDTPAKSYEMKKLFNPKLLHMIFID